MERYVVSVGLVGGYMPDSTYLCDNLEEARDVAKYEKEIWKEDNYTALPEQRVRISGNIEKDWQYIISHKGGATGDWEAWQHITIEPIEEEEKIEW